MAFPAKPAHAASAREEAGGSRKARTAASSPLPGNRELALAPAARPNTTAGLPEPLAASDATRLRRIFDFQARGDAASAAVETEFLQDRRLVGHVLADRWLRKIGPAPEPAELQAWLAAHADHPEAPEIYALLVERSPRGASLPPPPPDATLSSATDIVPEESVPAARSVVRNPALDRSVRDRAAAGDANGALRLISGTRGMTPAYAALLQADVALALFQAGQDEEAFRIAAQAVRGSPSHAQAAFVAGLAAWGRNVSTWRCPISRPRRGPTTRPPCCAPPPPSGRHGPPSGRGSRSSMSPGCSRRRRSRAPSTASWPGVPSG
ncbi:hypothetical protein MVG78_19390 [Roseomonas gilardii subsp. gilardii]|uniref:hypothetical protein n=1 Tax=Roseomonas gilardii TaxID=257708 RepID=UPI001FF7833F|nr:hypothetical protein [Roseomonas gilardii]UPG72604.1 hypothetical protein MVG78_19390 [Roseomonas gilardii subsp. gilardii]